MRLASATAALLVTLTSASIGAGTATAAEPIVVGSCSTSVQGTPGQPVSLSPSAVVGPVTDLINKIPLLGPPLAAPFKQAFTALPPIPIGAVQTGTTTITGGTIATQVVNELKKMPLLGPIIGTLATSVQTALTNGCGVVVTGVNKAAAPVQELPKNLPALPGSTATPPINPPGSQPPGGQPGTQPPGTNPGNPTGATPVGGVAASNGNFSLYSLGNNFGRVPLFSYGSLPFAMPGLYSPSPGVRYGSAVPRSTSDQGYNGDPVHTAGRAQALPRLQGVGGVGLPVLVAVLALSCVTGALVRTWVLRRTPA